MIKIPKYCEDILLTAQIVSFTLEEIINNAIPDFEEDIKNQKEKRRTKSLATANKISERINDWNTRLSLYSEDTFVDYHIQEYAEKKGRREWKSIVDTAKSTLKENDFPEKGFTCTLMAMGYMITALETLAELQAQEFRNKGYKEEPRFILNLLDKGKGLQKSLFKMMADQVNKYFRENDVRGCLHQEEFDKLATRTVKYMSEMADEQKVQIIKERGIKLAEQNAEYR